MVDKSSSESSGLTLFAAELAAVRASAGFSQGELAAQISYSESMVSLVETARRVPSLDFAQRCDKALGTPGTFARLQQHARLTPLPAWFRPWAEIEAVAAQLRLSEHSAVPGLLQTEDYARAVLAQRPAITADVLADAVAARMARQAVLTRAGKPPLIWIVMDESVLHRTVGSAKIMHEQLLYLAHMAELPNITVQVVPFGTGWHCGLSGSFAIADVDNAGEIAFLDTVTGGYIVERPSDVGQVVLRFNTLRAEALPRRATSERIMKRAEDFGSD
jgi:transcriptional regulator with XRE-family HTH domain